MKSGRRFRALPEAFRRKERQADCQGDGQHPSLYPSVGEEHLRDTRRKSPPEA